MCVCESYSEGKKHRKFSITFTLIVFVINVSALFSSCGKTVLSLIQCLVLKLLCNIRSYVLHEMSQLPCVKI